MNGTPEERPAAVPCGANQAGEAPPSADGLAPVWRRCAERAVWTERMLQALATGVKGNVWFSLIDKVWSKPNLRCAWEKVRKNGGAPGPDGVTVERFARHLDERLDRLHEDLKTGAYQPDAVRRAYVEKLGTDELRPLGIPNVADRVVQGALRHVLEPIFERKFLASSYGFARRSGRRTRCASSNAA
jgi:RNA-directed DNA polymerase